MKRLLFAMIASLFLTQVALANGDTDLPTLRVTKSVDINAPAAVVWNKVKDFNNLNGWHPAVAKDELIEGRNNHVGAVRLLTLGDGGTIHEKLLGYNAPGMNMTYAILKGVLPVSGYRSTIMVQALTDSTCRASWSGSFKHAPNSDDKTASDTISSVYQAGLDNLKKISEAQ